MKNPTKVKRIYLLPLGKIENNFFIRLAKDIEEWFGFEVKILDSIDIPDYAYDKIRNQYEASKILNEITRMDFPRLEKILAICNVDLFSDDLNFIFGQAEAPGKSALISVARLNPKSYGKKSNDELFYRRILKEAVHELGHTFGLSHCPDPKCVMHFSNTIEDTDIKGAGFCEKCKKLYELSQ